MTTNIEFLRDTLVRRIANGNANPADLAVLQQLLTCRRRHDLLVGACAALSLVLVPVILGLILH